MSVNVGYVHLDIYTLYVFQLGYIMSPGKQVRSSAVTYSSQLSRNLQVQEDEDVAQERFRIEHSDKVELLRYLNIFASFSLHINIIKSHCE